MTGPQGPLVRKANRAEFRLLMASAIVDQRWFNPGDWRAKRGIVPSGCRRPGSWQTESEFGHGPSNTVNSCASRLTHGKHDRGGRESAADTNPVRQHSTDYKQTSQFYHRSFLHDLAGPSRRSVRK